MTIHDPSEHAAPVTGAERIEALDVLRGFAVLGILVMNVQSFADVNAAYMNPAVHGQPAGLDLWLWALADVFASEKFMSIFSLLFGAGVLLFTSRLEARDRKPTGLHLRRMFWLWAIGMVHGYAFWYGDILTAYAVCGAVVFLLRGLRPSLLLVIGGVGLLGPLLLLVLFQVVLPHLPPEALEGMRESWAPDAATIAEETAAMRGGWLEQMPHRALQTVTMQTFVFFFFVAGRAGGLMLIGMALLKTGVLEAARSVRFYVTLLIVGAVAGLPLIVAGVVYKVETGFAMEQAMMTGSLFNYVGSLGLALAYIAAVMLMVRGRSLPPVRRGLAAAGRMAFSNYLGQTLICTLVFYGHGLGLFGRTERWQQAFLVLAIWAVQVAVSVWWLRRFRFGPMEWLWRSLTYWQRQPLRRPAGPVPTAPASPPPAP
jgi:uncharacterized protein